MLTKMLIIKKVVCQCTFTLVHICIISSWLQRFSTCIQVPGGYWEIAECYVYEFKLDHVSSSKGGLYHSTYIFSRMPYLWCNKSTRHWMWPMIVLKDICLEQIFQFIKNSTSTWNQTPLESNQLQPDGNIYSSPNSYLDTYATCHRSKESLENWLYN